MTREDSEGVIGKLTASDMAWAVVKYVDNELK